MNGREGSFMPQALVRKRCFVQMIGYEPVGVEHQHHFTIKAA